MKIARWTQEAQAKPAALDDEASQPSPEYADRVGRAALTAGRFLAEASRARAVLAGAVRKWRVRRTDFVLLYRIAKHGSEIVRLMHAMRDWRPARP